MKRYCLVILGGAVGAGILLLLLFIINGVFLAHGEMPLHGKTSHKTTSRATFPQNMSEIKVMAYNIAKGFIHKGGITFEKQDVAEKRLQQIAEVINAESPDIVFLSETIFECRLCPINQVTWLAEATGMAEWVFGENYNFGIPFFRIVGGNAILSRWPIAPVTNLTLAGRKPFYITKNNRRVLWGALQIGDEKILLSSVHNDSFDRTNNLAQTQQMLQYLGEQPAILGGDFNARPHEPPIQLIANTKRFMWADRGNFTFPAQKPAQKIDFIFAPAEWTLIEHKVIQSHASDHLPILSVFRR